MNQSAPANDSRPIALSSAVPQDLILRHQADPEAYETNRDLGLFLADTEDRKVDAYPYLAKALLFGRQDVESRLMLDSLGNILLLAGDPEMALETYGHARCKFPNTVDFDLRYGDALSRLGLIAEASTVYREATDRLHATARDTSCARGEPPVHLLEPHRLICSVFGEMAARLDLYLKARELGFFDRAEPILLADPGLVPNPCLLDHWRQHIRVVTEPEEVRAAAEAYRDNRIYLDYLTLPDGRTFRRDLAHAAVQAQWEAEQRPPLLRLDPEIRERGRVALERLGMPADAWFACLHVREHGFYAETAAWNRNRFRNADVRSYFPAIQAVTRRGGWVVRIGDQTMTPLPGSPQVIDLATTATRQDWLDIYCIAASRFMIATTSGPHNVADPFGVPVVGTNWFALGYWPLSENDLFIHKRLVRQGSCEPLTLSQALEPPLLGAWEPMIYARRGIDVIDNTPAEIREVVEEMLDRLDGKATESREETEAKETFRRLADPYGVGWRSRIGKAFLRRHPELLS